MVSRTSDWRDELGRWLKPFLDRLGHKRSRLERAGVPAECRTARTKPEMALAEIDRAIAAGVRFGCVLPARCRHRPPTFSRSQSRPVRRSAPTFSRVLPTSGPVRWPLSTSSRGLSPPPTRCHREPTRRSRLAPPTRRLRPSRTRTCSPPSSEFPICCGPTRRRLPAKPRVRPCRSGRRRLK